MDRARVQWVGAALLVLLSMLTLGCLPARQQARAMVGDGSGHTRALSWTFTPEAFQLDNDGYWYASEQAPFPFTAAAVHLRPNGAAGFPHVLELRLKPDDGDWSPWYPIFDLESEPDGRLYGENLVAWPLAREAQVRINVLGANMTGTQPADTSEALSEVLHDLTIVAIDATDGPTTAQAALSAETRATHQGLEVEGEAGVPQPTIISRAEWGADESWMTWPPNYAPVDKVIVHHTVSGGGDDPAAEVRSIYYYHAITRDWGDIGYNFLVDKFGNVYEGRYGGSDVIGAHVSYWNVGSVGVSVLGCYDNGACSAPRVPTSETLNAIANLGSWAASRNLIDPRALQSFDNGSTTIKNYVLSGHRDFGTTACPGGNLYAVLPDLRQMSWDRLPEYDVRFGTQNTPGKLEAGQAVTIYPNLFNAGRLTWRDVDGVRLGYRWFLGDTLVSESTTAAHLTANVGFAGMTALIAQLVAPDQAGSYTLRWDMYRDGVGWFAEQPAPAGRSQPLDIPVQIFKPTPEPTPTPDLPQIQAQFRPPSVQAGDVVTYELSVQGPTGSSFETLTLLPNGLARLSGKAGVFSGDLIPWDGVFDDGPIQIDFGLSVSPALTLPVALPLTTTLTVVDYLPVEHTSALIVNGYEFFLAHLSRSAPPTPTPSPTPTPTPSPKPSCSELLRNGGFETVGDWTINDTSYRAGYSTEQQHGGTWSMRLGVPPGGANTFSYSSIDQVVSIPANATTVSLSYWLYPLSTDLSGDWFDMLVQDGASWKYLYELRSDAQSWLPISQNLSAYAGRTITLRFRVFNDGGNGHTAAWLDDVSLQVCVP